MKSRSEEVIQTSTTVIQELSKGGNVIVCSALDGQETKRTINAGLSVGLTDGWIGSVISNANGKTAPYVLSRIGLSKLAVVGERRKRSMLRSQVG